MPVLSGYAEILCAHLAEYKRHTLDITEDGVWSRNGRAYPHIIPKEKLALNFLPALRGDIRRYLAEHRGARLHRDAHHLNSSQVMCINLMFPALLSADIREAIARMLGLPQTIRILDGSFEYVPDPLEATNFDFVAECSDGARLLWEFKLTESGFGTAPDDDAHRAKLAGIYAPRLRNLVRPGMLEPRYFFAHYQLLRNLWHVRPKDVLLLALPAGHQVLRTQAEAFLNDLVDAVRQRIRILYTEDIALGFAEASSHDARLVGHFKDFMHKYVPSGATGTR